MASGVSTDNPEGRSTDTTAIAGIDVGDNRFKESRQRRPQASTEHGIHEQVASADLREVQFPGLRVVDLDDRVPEVTQYLQVLACIAAHTGDVANDEIETSTPRCRSVRATTKPSPPLLPRPHKTATRRAGRSENIASIGAPDGTLVPLPRDYSWDRALQSGELADTTFL